jgi:hypothetical protein
MPPYVVHYQRSVDPVAFATRHDLVKALQANPRLLDNMEFVLAFEKFRELSDDESAKGGSPSFDGTAFR